MVSSFTVQRFWLHMKRYRMFFLGSMVVFSVMSLIFGLIFPGEDAMEAFIQVPVIQLITGVREIPNPGFLIWILLIFNSYMLSIFYPVVGIFLGVKILPFKEKDGKELLFSINKSPISFFLENLLIIVVLIPAVVLPSYLIVAGFMLSSGGGLVEITIAFILPVFFVYVVTLVTSLGSSIKSSPRMGYIFGGSFFALSFTLNLLQAEIEIFKDINLMSQINAFHHAIEGSWNLPFILICTILMAALSVLTIVFLYMTDYIASRTSQHESANNGMFGRSKFSFIRSPIEPALSRLGWKYPALRDQLEASAGYFLIYALFTSFLLFIVALSYPGDKLMLEAVAQVEFLSTPAIAAFMFGHTITPTLEGFLLLKIMTFHWMYYGPLLFIATYNIVQRDSNAGYDEITWSMPRTRARIIISRSLGDIIYLWLVMIANWVVLWVGVFILGTYSSVTYPDVAATVLAFFFLGVGYSFFLLLFVAIALLPKPKFLIAALVFIFLVALILPILAYMDDALSWMLVLSPFYYFDVAGLLLRDIDLVKKVLPDTIIFGVVTAVVYVTIVKYWTPRRDIT